MRYDYMGEDDWDNTSLNNLDLRYSMYENEKTYGVLSYFKYWADYWLGL